MLSVNAARCMMMSYHSMLQNSLKDVSSFSRLATRKCKQNKK